MQHHEWMDDMNELTNGDVNVVVADVVAESKTKTPRASRVRRPRVVAADAVKTFDDVVGIARTITPDNFADVVGAVNASAAIPHAARNVGRFTRGRIGDVQNETLRDNESESMRLDDVQLLAVWCMEFPAAVGRVFDANREPSQSAIVRGVGIVRGVRADYNRPGGTNPHHGAKFAVVPNSSNSYGMKRVTFASTPAYVP